MAQQAINALNYAERLIHTGVKPEYAKERIGIYMELMLDHFATKQDLKDTEDRLRGEIQEVRSEVKEVRSEVKELESSLTIEIHKSMAWCVLANVTLVTGIVSLIHYISG